MIRDERFDLVVVGGGPAGSTCAALVARVGLSVALVEKERFPREKICGDCINPRCWEILRLLGAAAAVEAAPHSTVASVRIVGLTGREVILPLGNAGGGHYVAIRRGMIDTILLGQARREGVTVFEGAQLTGLEPGPPFRLRVTKDGQQHELSSVWLVGADGRNSTVAALSAAPRRYADVSQPRVGLQWFARGPAVESGCVHLFLLPDGYAGVVEVEPGVTNIALVTGSKRGMGRAVGRLESLGPLLGGNAELGRLQSLLMPVSRVLAASPITPRTRVSPAPHVLLAGDARRTVEPFTGEGVFFAMRDGVEAARIVLLGSKRSFRFPAATHSDLLVNRILSPVLRSGPARRFIVGTARSVPWLARLGVRMVVPQKM